MRTLNSAKILTISIALAASIIGSQHVLADKQSLSIGDFFSTEHMITQEGTRPWMRFAEEKAGGTIQFNHFPSSQAAPANGLLDAVRSGVLDMAIIGPAYNVDTLTLNSLVGLPGLYDSAVEGTKALQAVMKEGPLLDEFLDAGVVPIFSLASPPYQVLLKDKQVGLPAEWKGLDIRTSGTTQAMTVRSLGASAVSLPGPEVYMGIERGRIDGVLFPLASVAAYNLQEVVKHISSNGSFGGYSYALVVNKKVFESLSDNERQAMIEAGQAIAPQLAKALDDSAESLAEDWDSQGLNVFKFTDEEILALKGSMASLKNDWVRRISRHNSDAAKALADFDRAVDDVSSNTDH